MAKIHVWMLYRGGPTEDVAMQPFFKQQMEDPYLLNLGRGLLRRLWMRILIWWRKKDCERFQLTGPCPSHLSSREQSLELTRVLGSDYRCTNVHRYQGKNAAERLKETPLHTTVLLLPLVPFRGGVLYSALNEARSQLQEKGISYIEAPPLSTTTAFPEVYAECIREAIIDMQKKDSYAILLFVSIDALNWSTLETETHKEFEQFLQVIQTNVHPSVQILTALSIREAKEKLLALQNTSHILYGHPFAICDTYETLPSQLSQLPFDFVDIPSPNTRPSFIRALAEIVWEYAPIE